MDCGEVQDRLPDRAAERLDPTTAGQVDRHLAACPDCRGVYRAVQSLEGTRPPVPVDLEARVLTAVRQVASGRTAEGASSGASPVTELPGRAGPRRFRLSPAWGLAAAAVLALAIGLPVVSPNDPGEADDVPALALAEEGVGGVWLDDDLMVAGAPAVSELSDEALQALLEEMER